MTTPSIASLIAITQILFGSAVVFLVFFQVMKRIRNYEILPYLTYGAFILTLCGIAFGKYYAGTAPRRLKSIEVSRPLAAIAGYTEAIHLNPGEADLYFRRGRTDFNLKRYEDAVIDFTKALDISPGNSQYLASRGMAYLFMGKFDLAEGDVNLAIKKGFRDSEVKLAEGMLSETYGRYPEAISAYTEALSAHDLDGINRCTALLNRSVVFMLQKDYRSAINDSTQVISDCDNDSRESAFVNRANASKASGDYSAAFADWEAALRLDPNDPVIFRNRAGAYWNKERLDLALSDYTRYLQLRPADAYSFMIRSDIYRQMGDITHAEADRKKADELINTNQARVYPLHTGPLSLPAASPKE